MLSLAATDPRRCPRSERGGPQLPDALASCSLSLAATSLCSSPPPSLAATDPHPPLSLSLAGMLDLILVLRLNLKLGIPDFVFIVADECVSRLIGRLKWMPLLVLSAKLCPSGIEGTFFALLMSIDNVGLLSASWFGGLLLNILKVTREDFNNLWAAILIRNVMRILPLALLFLVPNSDQHSTLLPAEMLMVNSNPEDHEAKVDDIELVSLVDNSR